MSVSYTKTAWVNGSTPPINATNLNKIEQGIEDCANEINALSSTVDDLDAAIDNKADADSVYNKSQVNNALANKQNKFCAVDPTTSGYYDLLNLDNIKVRLYNFKAIAPTSSTDDEDIMNRQMVSEAISQFFIEIDGYVENTVQQLVHGGDGTLHWVTIN